MIRRKHKKWKPPPKEYGGTLTGWFLWKFNETAVCIKHHDNMIAFLARQDVAIEHGQSPQDLVCTKLPDNIMDVKHDNPKTQIQMPILRETREVSSEE